jgi:hypothetical protein
MAIGITQNSKKPANAIAEMTKGMTASARSTTSLGMLPSLVSPLSSFGATASSATENQTINYYAAPNQSIDAELALLQAIQRAKVITGW